MNFLNISFNNPVKDKLLVYSTSMQTFESCLLNSQGVAIIHANLRTGINNINISNIAEGVYLLLITDTEGNQDIYKILKM